MALREELLGIKGIGPTLADQIMAVVENFAATVPDAPSEVTVISGTDPALVTALRAAKTGCNPPNGCPLCGVDGCHERCPAWNV